MQRYFQISVHALIVSAFIALALTGRLDAPSVVIFTIALLISVARTIRLMPPMVSAKAAFYLSCVYIFFFLLDSFLLSRSFIPATIHLVLFLELIKLFQEKTDKDYLYLIILSFLKILAASSLTIDMSFVVTLFLFLVALVSTLMSFDMYRSERKMAATSQKVALSLGGMSVWATGWIVLTGVVLFFIIPRVGTGYFSRATTQTLLLSGFTENVTLGESGQVKLSSAVVMHAKQISGTPFGALKWRGIALDAFDGKTWSKTDRRRQRMNVTPDEQYWLKPLKGIGDEVRFEFLLEPLATTTLFGPHEIRAVSGKLQGGIQLDNDDNINSRFQPVSRVQYQVLSEVPDRSRSFTTAIKEETTDPNESSKYLQLPVDLDPRVTALALQIAGKAKSVAEKASLVEGYLKRNYEYTLNLTWTPGSQPISTFLFDSKVGHCEYFASSMAILLRAAGVRTRLVNGFLMGEYNPVGEDYIVRQSDAHSWVEVFVPGHGWLEYDPTPPDSRDHATGIAVTLSHYFDAGELFWNSYVLIYDSGSQMLLFRNAQDRLQSVQESLRVSSDRLMTDATGTLDRATVRLRDYVDTPGFWVVIILILAVSVGIGKRRRIGTQIQIWRLRRGSGVVDERVVEELFYRATRLAERRGKKRREAETWREWIFGMPDPDNRSILALALGVFEKSKYGRVPVSPAEFVILEETIRKLDSR
jgi:transglutaminase-like putative cysteine protease